MSADPIRPFPIAAVDGIGEGLLRGGRRDREPKIRIHQRGVQWKQGVVVYMIL